MVDVTNTAELQATLGKLNEYAEPLWGKMTPQHVIEHLTMSVKLANGKKEVKQFTTPEEAEAIKAKLIHSDEPFGMGIKSPLLTDELPALLNPNLQSAKNELMEELAEFTARAQKTPDAVVLHPRMGNLTAKEWNKLMNKHFTHHFKQYDLVK